MELAGSVVAINGAAGGIGCALPEEAVRRGLKVAISDMRPDALEATRVRLDSDVLTVRADVTASGDVKAFAAAGATIERFGKVNVLVSDADAFVAGLAWEEPEAQFALMRDLNVAGIAHGFRAFVTRMHGAGCHIATIASGVAMTVHSVYPSYEIMKQATLALTKALYLDLRAEEIALIGVTIASRRSSRPVSCRARGRARRLATQQAGAFQEPHCARDGADDAQPRRRLRDGAGRRRHPSVRGDRSGQLYVLPGYDDPVDTAKAQAMGDGRATRIDPHGPMLAGIIGSMDRTGATATATATTNAGYRA